MKLMNAIGRWFRDLYRVWRREFYLVFTDMGVLIFFFGLPTLYPIVYTLIYNPEIPVNIPVVVVDNCRTAASRDFARTVNATQAIEVTGYAANLQEARRAMNEHRCYGIMKIPHDYDSRLGRGEQAVVPFYSEMSLLLRYRSFLLALANVQIATGAKIQQQLLAQGGLLTQNIADEGTPVSVKEEFIGDPTQGFASFVMPGIVILILQQSLILGVAMLAGGSAERRRRTGGYDPMMVNAPATATLAGKVLCYLIIYLPLIYYITHLVPVMFSLPHVGNPFHYVVFLIPMIVASAMLGIVLGTLVSERESSLLVVVFTSVLFLFLSGLLWPRYAMSAAWKMVGDLIPATWGVEGFVRMNSDGGTFAQQSPPYLAMWALALGYGVVAWMIVRYRRARNRRLAPEPEHF